MPTVINNPGENTGNNNAVLNIILVIVVILGIALFLIYGLPMLRGGAAPAQNGIDVNVKLPSGDNNQQQPQQQQPQQPTP